MIRGRKQKKLLNLAREYEFFDLIGEDVDKILDIFRIVGEILYWVPIKCGVYTHIFCYGDTAIAIKRSDTRQRHRLIIDMVKRISGDDKLSDSIWVQKKITDLIKIKFAIYNMYGNQYKFFLCVDTIITLLYNFFKSGEKSLAITLSESKIHLIITQNPNGELLFAFDQPYQENNGWF